MKDKLEDLILEVIQSAPPPGKGNMLGLYAHALAALACQKKSQEGAAPFRSLAEAWNSPMAKPMREYIDIWGEGVPISSMNDAALKERCDSLSATLPEKTNLRAAFYACVKLLYVSQLWGRMGDVHCTTSQLSKTAPEVVFEVLSELEKKIPGSTQA